MIYRIKYKGYGGIISLIILNVQYVNVNPKCSLYGGKIKGYEIITHEIEVDKLV